MNRFRSGLVPLCALLVLAGCSSEPTGDLRDTTPEIVATPTQLFIELGGTKTVEVGAVDAQGNPLDFNYEVTSTGAGITVRRDSSFLPIFVNDSTLQAPAVGPRFRFIVEGTGYAATSFTVSAGGVEKVIPVQVVPEAGIAATFDNPTPALGDTITLTAPAGVTFADTANLEIVGNTLIPVIVSQDATTIRFIAPPSVNSPITIHGVISQSAPTVVFAPATQTPLQTPLIDTVDVVYSTTTPTLGQTVTMSVPEPLIRLAVDSIVYPDQLPGRAAGPQNIVIAPDSSSLTFDTPPNANGSGTVVNFKFPGGFLIALPTRPNYTAPNIGTELDATFSTQTPGLLEAVTLTAPAGFTFAPDVAIAIAGQPVIIQSVAGDGSSVTFLPIPGSIGTAAIDGVVPTAAPSNILTMSTVQSITVPPLTPLEGTEDAATAPTISTSGETIDAGSFGATECGGNSGFPCQLYKISLAAPTTLTVSVEGSNAADLGLYFLNPADLSDAVDTGGDQLVCDALGRASPPESCSLDFPAGDYIMAVVSFGPGYPENDPNPAFITLNIN